MTNQQFSQVLIQNNGCLPPSLPADIYATGTPSPLCDFSPVNVSAFISAIQTANGTPATDNICLAQNGTYTLTAAHAGLNGLPPIASNINIIGNGATLTRQSGSPNFRLFEVAAGGTLTL
ncbi:MAG: hypothetical protein K8I82_20280 [Anaerolineae bacterium]|nr:hypothetical protein [Anaerolineae bacterium]